GSVGEARSKALFLRTYSSDVTFLSLDGELDSERGLRDLSRAGIRVASAHVTAFERRGDNMVVIMKDGTVESIDVIYSVLGCVVRSELGMNLGARHNDIGCLE